MFCRAAILCILDPGSCVHYGLTIKGCMGDLPRIIGLGESARVVTKAILCLSCCQFLEGERSALPTQTPELGGPSTRSIAVVRKPCSAGLFACSAGNFWARGDLLGLCKMPTVKIAAAVAARSDPHAWCGFVLLWEDSRANQVATARVFAAPRLCCCSQILCYSLCFWEGVGWDCCTPACSALSLLLLALPQREETSRCHRCSLLCWRQSQQGKSCPTHNMVRLMESPQLK